jgi:hypothetical protein
MRNTLNQEIELKHTACLVFQSSDVANNDRRGLVMTCDPVVTSKTAASIPHNATDSWYF